jgi:hypothetical protein
MTAARKPLPTQTRDAFAKVLRHYACAWCGVVTHAEVLEDVEGERVCPACVDEDHREREALEGDGRPVAISESEEWR